MRLLLFSENDHKNQLVSKPDCSIETQNKKIILAQFHDCSRKMHIRRLQHLAVNFELLHVCRQILAYSKVWNSILSVVIFYHSLAGFYYLRSINQNHSSDQFYQLEANLILLSLMLITCVMAAGWKIAAKAKRISLLNEQFYLAFCSKGGLEILPVADVIKVFA